MGYKGALRVEASTTRRNAPGKQGTSDEEVDSDAKKGVGCRRSCRALVKDRR